MSKKDLIDLIRAFEAFDRLNNLVKELTNGSAIENRRFFGTILHRRCYP